MSENPRHFNIFTTHVIANMSVAPFVSTTVEVPCPTDGTYMLNMFSPSGASTFFTTWLVTLIRGKLAVFGDTPNSCVWFSLCFAFDA